MLKPSHIREVKGVWKHPWTLTISYWYGCRGHKLSGRAVGRGRHDLFSERAIDHAPSRGWTTNLDWQRPQWGTNDTSVKYGSSWRRDMTFIQQVLYAWGIWCSVRSCCARVARSAASEISTPLMNEVGVVDGMQAIGTYKRRCSRDNALCGALMLCRKLTCRS